MSDNAESAGSAQALPARSPRTVRLETPRVRLEAVTPEDYRFLQLVDTSTEQVAGGRFRGATPSPEQWTHSLWAGVLAQFLVLPIARDRPPVGLVSALNPSFQDGHCRVAVRGFDPQGSPPILYEGFALFVEYVLTCWNLRKLFMEVPEYEYARMASGSGRYFEVQGRLSEYYYFGGEYWDQVILSISRENWGRVGGLLTEITAKDQSLQSSDAAGGALSQWLSEASGVDREAINKDTLLVGDLHLDSLALAELAIYAMDRLGASGLDDGGASLEGASVGAILDALAPPTIG